MANTKQTKKSSAGNKQKKKQAQVTVRKGGGRPVGLDVPARDYARLLNDPCYGNIVSPVYSSSGSGNFVRVESDFILGAEATAVGAALIFTPGYAVPAGSVAQAVVKPTTVVDGDGSLIAWQGSTSLQPGLGVQGIMGSARCVAACAQVSYVGSELSRAGIVSLTQTTREAALNTVTLATMRQMAQRVVRMPDGVLEIKLAPTGSSSTFVDCGAGLPASAVSEMPSLVIGVSGIPASVGVRFRLVQILEWLPRSASGTIANSTQTESTATLSMVLTELKRARPDWQYELLTGMGAYAAKAITWI